MVNISITASEIASNPLIQQSPSSYVLNLGTITKVIIPSSVRAKSNSADPVRDGGQFFISLRPHETFPVENEVFQALVNNAVNGGEGSFLSQLLYFVNRGVIEIRQDNGSPLTAKQILSYTAP